MAAELGIDTVFAEVLPQDKLGKVQELKRAGERVGMADGVNDARPWSRPTSAWPSARGRTWQSKRATSC